MNSRPTNPLPSVEAQTVAFVEHARADRDYYCRWLTFNGFYVYLRYHPDFRPREEIALGEMLVIANVEIPERYRRRGWLWRYCQLCAALVDNGVALESVCNPALRASLRNRPVFEELWSGFFVLKKRHPADRPLILQNGGDSEAYKTGSLFVVSEERAQHPAPDS